MKTLDILMDEHRVIEKVMASLNDYAYQVRSGADVPVSHLSRYVSFFQEFADRLHHAKEEDILFTRMIETGFPKNGGPLGCMSEEHNQGRAHIAALAEIAKEKEWTVEHRDQTAAHAFAFTSLLLAHIQKEYNVLYPMAQANLPPGWLEEMEADFEKHEQGLPQGESARLLNEAEEIVNLYKSQPVEV